MSAVVASILAVVRKRMQQLPTLLALDVGSCRVHLGSGAQTDATTPNIVATCSASWEGYKNVERAVQRDLISTLLRYASAITEQRKCWGLLAQTFNRFRTALQLPTARDNIQHDVQTEQHVTSNNAGSCWPAMLRPFSRGLKNIVTHILPFLLQFFLVIRWYRSFYSSFSLLRFGYLETINIKALNGEFFITEMLTQQL